MTPTPAPERTGAGPTPEIGCPTGTGPRSDSNTRDSDTARARRNVAASIDTAIGFVATQEGGPGRILTTHERLPDGTCRGCLTTSTRWPCSVAAIALGVLDSARAAGTP